MLILAGLGFEEKDISLKTIKKAEKAEKIFVELYTSLWLGDLKRLEKLIGKKVEVVPREKLEQKGHELIDEAKQKDVLLLVPGDPLIATTHQALLLEAKKAKVKTEVIHAPSIYTAIAECGLNMYKFGRTVTIPFPERTQGVLPYSLYEAIKLNKQAGLHTLCLLDLEVEMGKFMEPKMAVEILLTLERNFKQGVLYENEEVLLLTKVGSQRQRIKLLKLNEIKEKEVPAVLILFGKLDEFEKEFLKSYTEIP